MQHLSTLSFFLFTILFFNLSLSQICLDLPAMDGAPDSFVSPVGWSIWNSSPDIISGNGVYPGTSSANVIDVNGTSIAGGEMVFLLVNGVLGANTEGVRTQFSGLTIGETYFVLVQWQQVTLDYAGISSDPSGGKLGVYLDGVNLMIFTSSGGVNDLWQTASVSFIATSTSHTIGLKGELPNNSNRGAIVIDNYPCPVFLSMDLSAFEVVKKQDHVLLTWETASEKNSDYFEVERSINLTDWNTIGMLNSMDSTSTSRSYSLSDEQPLEGKSYYRLKQFDLNGEFVYSDIRSMYFIRAEFEEMLIFPNPAKDIVTITSIDCADLSITEVSGRIIDHQSMVVSIFEKSITFDLSGLAPGTYMVQSGQLVKRLIKN